jgi:hypothetical protein
VWAIRPDVIAHDVDRDGDLDLVVASFSRIAWLENRLDQNPSTWLSHTVDSTVVAASSVAVADVDGNGETEIVSGCINSPLLAWWGRPTVLTNPWTRHEIQNSDKITDVSVVDLDADGDQDIISSRWNASSGGLTLWENTGGAAFVDRELGGVYSPGPGRPRSATSTPTATSTSRLPPEDSDLVEVIENVTIHSTADVTIVASKSVEGALPRPLDLGVTDLDGDGDLDIVSYDDTQRLHWRDMPDDAPTLLQATSAVLNTDAFELADIDNDGGHRRRHGALRRAGVAGESRLRQPVRAPHHRLGLDHRARHGRGLRPRWPTRRDRAEQRDHGSALVAESGQWPELVREPAGNHDHQFQRPGDRRSGPRRRGRGGDRRRR